jgi:hypothetical protein
MKFFQTKMIQDFIALITSVEDHTKVDARFGDILKMNVEYNQNLIVVFATENLMINNQ